MSPLTKVPDSHVTASDHNGEKYTSPAMSCVVRVADFSSKSYWDRRFESESSFEWLQPSSSILPTIKAEVEAQYGAAILHLGSGSSDLSNQLRRIASPNNDVSRSTALDQSLILNVDFSPAAIEIGRRREREEFGDDRNGDMRWAVVDLLDWASFKPICNEHCGKTFDLIVEKSCTDALACGPDVPLGPPFDGSEESSIYWESELYPKHVAPEVALATYLSAVTHPGAAWIALSYSAERFDFLRDVGHPAARLWSVERVQKLIVDDGDGVGPARTVYRPEITHFVYTMRRSSIRKE